MTSTNDTSKPRKPLAGTPAPPGKPEQGASDHDAIEERIERLEKRLEETIDGIEGSATVRSTRVIDDAAKGDPLRRAVDRSNDKRDTDK